VRITDSAMVAAAVLSNRYITERFLPDKAIDLVDEAASRMRIELDSMPTELDELERRRVQLEIEREALRKEKDDSSRARLEALERELADISEDATALRTQWETEKSAIAELRKTKTELEQLQHDVETAEREADLARAAELKYGRLPELHARLREQETGITDSAGTRRLLKEEVDADDIARIVASWTGIPVTRLLEGEQAKLIQMEERLHDRVVGQERRSPPSPTRSAVPVPASRTRSDPSGRSSSSAPRASGRPSSRGRSPSSCSTTSRRSPAST
jgi:ATP-dependent Clp protease ATP-binding subunit ClpB